MNWEYDSSVSTDIGEQKSAVHQEMVKQANLYAENEKQVYLAAAARFRLPYWDILMPRTDDSKPDKNNSVDWKTVWACPQLLKAKTVFVKLPKGDAQKAQEGFSEIDNPLASFTFPTSDEFKDHPKRKKLEFYEKEWDLIQHEHRASLLTKS